MILGAQMIANCETFLPAEEPGFDAETYYGTVSQAFGQNWSMFSYCPVPSVGSQTLADRGYEVGLTTVLLLKDLELAIAAARVAENAASLGQAAMVLNKATDAERFGHSDFSRTMRPIEDPAPSTGS